MRDDFVAGCLLPILMAGVLFLFAAIAITKSIAWLRFAFGACS